jgi:hypothetical protein
VLHGKLKVKLSWVASWPNVLTLATPALAQNRNVESLALKAFFTRTGEPLKRVCKYGFKDDKGEEVIALRFQRAEDFSEGLAAVQVNGRWGFIL